jgi:hypothetical protein
MRRFVSLHETDDGVIARLESFPGNAGLSSVPATVGEVRELMMFDQSMDEARELLATQDGLYWELIGCGEYCGSDETDHFEALDRLLTCTSSDTPTEPFDGRAVPDTCAYDASATEAPNPLGMRTFLSVGADLADPSAVRFTVEHFPSNVSAGDVAATLASQRDLVVYVDGDLEAARKLVADATTGLASDLLQLGDDSAATYAEIDAVLTCE